MQWLRWSAVIALVAGLTIGLIADRFKIRSCDEVTAENGWQEAAVLLGCHEMEP